MYVDIKLREAFRNEIRDFAMKLRDGIVSEVDNIENIKDRYLKLYKDSLESYTTPKRYKTSVAKETLNEDFKNTISEIQSERV